MQKKIPEKYKLNNQVTLIKADNKGELTSF